MAKEKYKGHLAALLAIVIWGTTFISTKILLVDFQPVEILFYRFLIGYVVLLILDPHRAKRESWRKEIAFIAAGFTGVCLYYLLENVALTYTTASNVGVIICVSPFFTAILAYLFVKPREKLRIHFFIGFLVAMTGILLIHAHGAQLQLNPTGDLLAFAAAFVWACYSILAKRIGEFGIPVILATRKIFFYGLLFIVLVLLGLGVPMSWRVPTMRNALNLLYLGIGASALCFVTWNYAVKRLGAMKTSVYIYIVPVITVITSMLILKESATIFSVLGTLFTITGLFLSEYGYTKRPKEKMNESRRIKNGFIK